MARDRLAPEPQGGGRSRQAAPLQSRRLSARQPDDAGLYSPETNRLVPRPRHTTDRLRLNNSLTSHSDGASRPRWRSTRQSERRAPSHHPATPSALRHYVSASSHSSEQKREIAVSKQTPFTVSSRYHLAAWLAQFGDSSEMKTNARANVTSSECTKSTFEARSPSTCYRLLRR